MAQIFGNFSENLPNGQEYLTVVFAPSSTPLKQRWQNNSLSADFIAEYFANFFPETTENNIEINLKAEVKSAVSFISNELLENAMKFNDSTLQEPVTMTLQMYSDKLVFFATNTVNPQRTIKFQQFIEELINSDPNDFYINQLEKNAEDEIIGSSGLGFLTMINDYLAKIGWKFETMKKEPQVDTVTTMVELTVYQLHSSSISQELETYAN